MAAKFHLLLIILLLLGTQPFASIAKKYYMAKELTEYFGFGSETSFILRFVYESIKWFPSLKPKIFEFEQFKVKHL